MLGERAALLRDKVAFYDARRSVSYAELNQRTSRLAGHLVHLGVRPGERALIYMDNRTETAECYLALTRASLVGVCGNPQAAPAEIGYMLRDSQAGVVLTDEAHLHHVRALLAERGDADTTHVVLVEMNTAG